MTQAAYARHRARLGLPGSSREAVRKAVAESRIDLLPNRRIDPAAADRAWAERSVPRVEASSDGAQSVSRELVTVRTQRELVRRQLDEFRLAQALGETVRAAEIIDAATECTRVTYERLLNLARRLGPVVAVCSDPLECTRIIEREVETLAEELRQPIRLLPGGPEVIASAGTQGLAYPPLPPGPRLIGRGGR